VREERRASEDNWELVMPSCASCWQFIAMMPCMYSLRPATSLALSPQMEAMSLAVMFGKEGAMANICWNCNILCWSATTLLH